MQKNIYLTNVIDAGVRFGPHPSWESFPGDLRYFGFDPDKSEIERLSKFRPDARCQYIAKGLGETETPIKLNIYKHKGYSSELKVNPKSFWFSGHRKGEGEIIETREAPCTTIDQFAKDNSVDIDFIKADTEGTELKVLRGGTTQIDHHVLGLRIEVNFAVQYLGQDNFCDIHSFLLSKGFYLLNLDYFGRGTPRNRLFRQPDPHALSTDRYGVLISSDGVWVRDLSQLPSAKGEMLEARVLKLAAFCLCNSAADLAFELLIEQKPKSWSESALASPLYKKLKRTSAFYLGRWRAVPDDQWEYCQKLYADIFGEHLPSGSEFWEYAQAL